MDSKGNVTETLVTKDKNIKTGKSIIILSSNELIRIFDILQCCSTDGSISIPSINGVAGVISFINKINATDGTSFDEIYDCSLFRHLISDIIDKNLTDTIKLALSFKNIEIKYSSESVYQLSPVQQSSTQTKKYIELKSLKSIFDVYDTLM